MKETSNYSLLLIYRPRKDERLGWPGWLTYSGRFTHISGHPSATGLGQDGKSSPAKDRRSTAVPRHQLRCSLIIIIIVAARNKLLNYLLTILLQYFRASLELVQLIYCLCKL